MSERPNTSVWGGRPRREPRTARKAACDWRKRVRSTSRRKTRARARSSASRMRSSWSIENGHAVVLTTHTPLPFPFTDRLVRAPRPASIGAANGSAERCSDAPVKSVWAAAKKQGPVLVHYRRRCARGCAYPLALRDSRHKRPPHGALTASEARLRLAWRSSRRSLR